MTPSPFFPSNFFLHTLETSSAQDNVKYTHGLNYMRISVQFLSSSPVNEERGGGGAKIEIELADMIEKYWISTGTVVIDNVLMCVVQSPIFNIRSVIPD